MKQVVNLYLPEFRKKPDWLNATRMLQSAGVVLLLLAVGAVWEYWQLFRLEREWQVVEALRVEAVNSTQQLRASFGTQAPDQSIVEENMRLESSLQEKNTLLQFMEGNDLGNTSGFSSYLADLARYHLQGLSLNMISLSQDGRSVVLRGEVDRAELVPLYLQNLNSGNSFRGRSFHALQIAELTSPEDKDAPQRLFQFTVSTIQ